LFPAERLQGSRSLAVLAGSFNPLTSAHLALAEAAERQHLGPVAFTLSTRTVDKERPEPAFLPDRLLVLELSVERTGHRLVGLLNRGLYVDQAALLRAALPRLERLVFLVGFDKIVQIFDPRYYDDREAALGRLFSVASFAVAPRGRAGRAELDELLERAENRAFAGGVSPLEVAPGLGDDSSSLARAALGRGEQPSVSLPPESVAFIEATGCYGPDETRYAVRQVRWLGG
jgi:nicotinic acid mononucleotide adenylyltransferase